jgi:Fe2+ or Zn2+ uptake regulation protein
VKVEEVASALNSGMRRSILLVLAEGPETTQGVIRRLDQRGQAIKHRETVYRALENLVRSGLADKTYHPGKGLCYRLKVRRVAIDIGTGTVRTSDVDSRRG